MLTVPFERQGLHVMVKPIGPICNLDCEYCYYLHKEELYPRGEKWKMNDSLLESFIRQYFEAQPEGINEVTFAWQGGEPTLLGVAFFEQVVKLQRELAPAGTQVNNSLQTNGVLLDETWAKFFKSSGFLIGLSLDGPREVHDKYRYDKQGNPTFEKVMRGLKLLKQYEVEFNVLVVVNRENVRLKKKVYTYLRDNGVEFMQFIPIVERRGVGAHAEVPLELPGESSEKQALVSSRSVSARDYGEFLIDIFDEWSRRDIGKVFVQIFDQALGAWMDQEPGLCIFRRECGRALALEHNGDLYSCDHYVEPDWKLGNIERTELVQLANSEPQRKFGADKKSTLPQYCQECEVRFICNGGCPKNRFIETPTGESGLNYLCEGYRRFFNHIDPLMKKMAHEIRAGRSPANVISRHKSKSNSPGTPSRNAACPCGSGRKYKKCCGA